MDVESLCDTGTVDDHCEIDSAFDLPANTSITGTGDFTLQDGGEIRSPSFELDFPSGQVTVASGGTLTGSVLVMAGAFDLASGGVINATGAGPSGGNQFTDGASDNGGAGTSSASYGDRGGGGAGHAAPGGTGESSVPAGSSYGDPLAPDTPGSGGGGGDCGVAGDGGGTVKLTVTEQATVNGRIEVNGTDSAVADCGTCGTGGGGSAGSVWIVADSIGGSGTIEAIGGEASTTPSGQRGGGGAGGYIKFDYMTADEFSGNGTTDVSGGAGYSSGGDGSVCKDDGGGATCI